ncbi:MAG: ERF family protein [Sphaerospermopsis kisseleviana]
MSTPNLNKALAEAKKKIPAITVSRQAEIPTKTRKISFTYAELEEIQKLIVPVISEFGLSIVHQVQYPDGRILLRTTLRHESGEELESVLPITTELIAFGSGDYKDIATAIAYSRRYNFLCLLDVCVVEPDDWQATKRWLGKEINEEVKKNPEYHRAVNPDAPQPKSDKPSAAQLSRMWAIASDRNIPKDRVRQLIRNIAGVESGKDIPLSKYDEIVRAIEETAPAVAPESESSIIETEIDRNLVNQEIDSLCKRKNITSEIGKQILGELWPGVAGRSQLSDRQLLEFRDYLSKSPAQSA